MNKSYIPRKESIVITAIEIIDELGIHELSTREIARRQGVSDASLYRHFNSKQDILLEVLDYYSNYDTFIINTIEQKNTPFKEKIIQFFKSYAEYYENYPAIIAVGLSHSVFLYDKLLSNKFNHILDTRSKFLQKLISSGQIENSINKKITVDILCHILQGTFNDITLNWRINGCSFPLKEKIIESMEMVLNNL
ncbi:TetR/AcrR family transcriptional regulator [Candidatus Clostridium stratigraminis]|uniref:TetR/AcrR family transcriptional regulator n=1 Tax=Candidatus Clostridium stratigraminis TaxID=3381661 RepID=A0ABW8T7J3_9CLOT